MSENHLKQISLIIFGIIALLAIVGVILLFAEESITGDASRLARAAAMNKARQAQQRALQQVAPVITPNPQQNIVAPMPCANSQLGDPCTTNNGMSGLCLGQGSLNCFQQTKPNKHGCTRFRNSCTPEPGVTGECRIADENSLSCYVNEEHYEVWKRKQQTQSIIQPQVPQQRIQCKPGYIELGNSCYATQSSCSSQGMQYDSALHDCYSPPPTQQTGQDCPPGMKKAQVGGPADFFCIASP